MSRFSFAGWKLMPEPDEKNPSRRPRYRELELAIIGGLKTLRDMAVNMEMRSADELLDKIIKDIEEHCFRVAVVGEFRRGKSTFINALLGRAVLPSDILPTTATLNRVTYGDHPHVLIRFRKQDGQAARTEEVPLHELTNYVTKITPTSES